MTLLARGAVTAALLLAACDSGTGTGTPPPTEREVRLVEVASGLSSPVHLTAPANDTRLFVVEQPGRIRVIADGVLLPQPFLDITARVGSGGERGLLSMAFHPAYAINGTFFVNFTDLAGDTRVERFRVSAADRNRADPASAELVIGIDQPFSNHNGGQIAFGPDGMLWIGMGDGGGGGDPQGHAQNPRSLLGKMLRLDVDGARPYAIPATNPAGPTGGPSEIWASGLRNPWRFSFDRQGGTLYVADVGQGAWEEVNAVSPTEGGIDYGWNVMEGTHCYAAATCDRDGRRLPVLEYGHEGGACSVTGGHVYRGADVPALAGRYVYADFCAGWVRSFRLQGAAATDPRTHDVGDVGNVLSFGEDARGELYLLTGDGRVHRFAPGN